MVVVNICRQPSFLHDNWHLIYVYICFTCFMAPLQLVLVSGGFSTPQLEHEAEFLVYTVQWMPHTQRLLRIMPTFIQYLQHSSIYVRTYYTCSIYKHTQQTGTGHTQILLIPIGTGTEMAIHLSELWDICEYNFIGKPCALSVHSLQMPNFIVFMRFMVCTKFYIFLSLPYTVCDSTATLYTDVHTSQSIFPLDVSAAFSCLCDFLTDDGNCKLPKHLN